MAKAKYNGLVNGHTGQLLAVSNNIDYLHGLAYERGLSVEQFELVKGLSSIKQVVGLYGKSYTVKQIKEMHRHWS